MNYSLVFCLQARQGQTTIIIACQFSTTLTADVIVGIVDGTVVEMGTHTELTEKKKPHYSHLTSQVLFIITAIIICIITVRRMISHRSNLHCG